MLSGEGFRGHRGSWGRLKSIGGAYRDRSPRSCATQGLHNTAHRVLVVFGAAAQGLAPPSSPHSATAAAVTELSAFRSEPRKVHPCVEHAATRLFWKSLWLP